MYPRTPSYSTNTMSFLIKRHGAKHLTWRAIDYHKNEKKHHQNKRLFILYLIADQFLAEHCR